MFFALVVVELRTEEMEVTAMTTDECDILELVKDAGSSLPPHSFKH